MMMKEKVEIDQEVFDLVDEIIGEDFGLNDGTLPVTNSPFAMEYERMKREKRRFEEMQRINVERYNRKKEGQQRAREIAKQNEERRKNREASRKWNEERRMAKLSLEKPRITMHHSNLSGVRLNKHPLDSLTIEEIDYLNRQYWDRWQHTFDFRNGIFTSWMLPKDTADGWVFGKAKSTEWSGLRKPVMTLYWVFLVLAVVRFSPLYFLISVLLELVAKRVDDKYIYSMRPNIELEDKISLELHKMIEESDKIGWEECIFDGKRANNDDNSNLDGDTHIVRD